jgi:hypothetical protein
MIGPFVNTLTYLKAPLFGTVSILQTESVILNQIAKHCMVLIQSLFLSFGDAQNWIHEQIILHTSNCLHFRLKASVAEAKPLDSTRLQSPISEPKRVEYPLYSKLVQDS